jgi:hypothetical protein
MRLSTRNIDWICLTLQYKVHVKKVSSMMIITSIHQIITIYCFTIRVSSIDYFVNFATDRTIQCIIADRSQSWIVSNDSSTFEQYEFFVSSC